MNIEKIKKCFQIKFLNLSFWLTLILAYVMPTKHSKLYGFPFEFFKIHSEIYTNSLITSSEFRILAFLMNVFVIFIILNLLNNFNYLIKNIITKDKENI